MLRIVRTVTSAQSPTLVWRQSKQMRPELMTCRTESVLVPYKFFPYSPDSMNFPAAKSVSKAGRLTKWYSRPFRSCILGFLVVSEPWKRINQFDWNHEFVDEYLILSCPRALTKRGLTWNCNGKLFRFNGQEPPTQLIVTAVCRTDQSDGAFTIGRLVIERHLLIGQDVIVVWRDSWEGLMKCSWQT